jgi:hypothetical protein
MSTRHQFIQSIDDLLTFLGQRVHDFSQLVRRKTISSGCRTTSVSSMMKIGLNRGSVTLSMYDFFTNGTTTRRLYPSKIADWTTTMYGIASRFPPQLR